MSGIEIQNLSGLLNNVWLLSAICSWCVAQCAKMTIGFIKTRTVDLHYIVSTGGMPSAHSATVSGLATTIGLTEGFGTPLFALALIHAIITMFDASTVRRAAGQQAAILNVMIRELFQEHRLRNARLKELLGHTRVEVLFGMLTGIAVGSLICVIVANQQHGGMVWPWS